MIPDSAATYRLQLNGHFDFHRGIAVLPYLKAMGITHVYASPILAAVPGSPHGYDVTDFTRVNPELGGAPGFERFCAALDDAGMGILLDIVPNHMAASGRDNPLWRDVLATGPMSSYAGFFDIQWGGVDEKTQRKLLLPILGRHYDDCLEKGELKLAHRHGVIVLTYFEHELPLAPATSKKILDAAARRFSLPEGRDPDAPVDHHGNAGLDALLEKINSDAAVLHELLEGQHYRLAYWRTAPHDINYRRFFDISDLVALRMEEETVFHRTHRLILKWVDRGVVDGIRIDHPDGLADPGEYLARLAKNAPAAHLLVEKILEPDERLPEDWPVSGTTGYDFLHRVNGLFVDPAGEGPLSRCYEEFTGRSCDYGETVRLKKHLILEQSFSGEVTALVRRLLNVRFEHLPYRDLVAPDLKTAVAEVISCFPVYRTYATPRRRGALSVSAADRRRIEAALGRARCHHPGMDERVWRFIKDLLTLKLTGENAAHAVVRFQQLTGPAMAKGVEDTAFYCFNRLISLNEVGGDPGRFGVSVGQFHEYCRFIQARYPGTLSATATHDTKRGEDVRLRINLLSEIPHQWRDAVRRWFNIATRYRSEGVPDANTLYFLLQTLAGVWPIDAKRLTAYMEKAVREAKEYTSWVNMDPFYEAALSGCIRQLLEDRGFVADLAAFASQLRGPSRVSALSQALIKCTAPGIPDFYQGAELWDLNLVDPDNRRPVDFDIRARLAGEIKRCKVSEVLSRWDGGLPKLYVIGRALAARREFPGAVGRRGGYRPIWARGSRAKHAVAFVRGDRLVTVAVRLMAGFDGDWADTCIDLPRGHWQNLLTGNARAGGRTRLCELLAEFPVALLARH